MPFGLTNTPALFQVLINNTLHPCLDHFAYAYLDDIVIYSRTLKEHILNVREVLRQLQSRKLFVQKEKCIFYKELIEFLGFIIGRQFIQIDPKKVELVASWLTLSRLKHLQAFLRFVNFYRQFIKNYSQQALRMTKLLKKNRAFQWNNEAQPSFQTLKKTFTHEKIFQHFHQSVEAILETNAFDDAIEGCLSQADNSRVLRLVAFYSRKLT